MRLKNTTENGNTFAISQYCLLRLNFELFQVCTIYFVFYLLTSLLWHLKVLKCWFTTLIFRKDTTGEEIKQRDNGNKYDNNPLVT